MKLQIKYNTKWERREYKNKRNRYRPLYDSRKRSEFIRNSIRKRVLKAQNLLEN